MTEEVKTTDQQLDLEATATAQAQPQGPDLNISDLVALKSIVEVASQRGAFKASELEAVGKAFNKLNTFLESVSKKD
jgi:hypothetical protein